ncbi:hypothetical protein [Nocardioides houyundeii]|uniref:hypothetical protein n=1 Tax=Nocardioides houyundeii TaxID=2045452 RepID=UPI000DF44405|nr:hypothetical protein [Nocardioides houyundeii]
MVLMEIDELSSTALLETASRTLRARRLAEVAEMQLAAQWAVLHGHPCDDDDPMIRPGGDGTPPVREFALPDLAISRDSHVATTRALMADTLDLQHRLPRTWAVVVSGSCEPWVARKVAVLSRSVPVETVGMVDASVARAIAGHSPSTVLEIARAKTVEADPEAFAMRREIERRRRYVALGKVDEFGFRHVIARVNAGDAAWVDALLDRVADVLADAQREEGNRDELRAEAFGWLARPAELLKLLLDHHVPDPGQPEETRPAWAPDHLLRTVERLATMSTRQLAALRGRGQVFVHVAAPSLLRQAGLSRVEGLGPMLLQALRELLGQADVRLTPVLDTALRPRVDQYEHPESSKDIAWLLSGGDVFPFSPRTATRDRVDFDHVEPYDPAGPPGQTGPHNASPLRRTHHRWKTHGGFRYRSCGRGRALWQTPFGTCVLVDERGSRRLSMEEAELMLGAPPGVDVYLSNAEIDLGVYR